MGQKTHPVGFRLGISKDWKSRYYAGRELPALLREDELLRKYLKARLGHAAISDIVIERKPSKVVVTLHTGQKAVDKKAPTPAAGTSAAPAATAPAARGAK